MNHWPMQHRILGEGKPTASAKSLNDSKKRYSVGELELLEVVWTLDFSDIKNTKNL